MNTKNKEICKTCGKEMTEIFDEIAGKFTGYLWRCECMPEGLVVSIG